MDRYNAIFEWEMSPAETQAFKMACVWEEQVAKMFPGIHLARLPRRGDPRKSNLFRYCWKMIRETRGLLKDDEYKLFIIANLQIIRANKGRIDPNVLCGDKAWVRWIVWKKLFDKKAKEVSGEQSIVEGEPDVKPVVHKEISLTKRFLFEKCEGEPTEEKIKKFVEGPQLRTWMNSGKVSKYYLALSPWVGKVIDHDRMEAKYHFDPQNFLDRASKGVRDLFRKEFAHEYKNGSQ